MAENTSDAAEQLEFDEDVESDPAYTDEIGSDWTGEGGATEYGPATDFENPVPTAQEMLDNGL